MAGSLTRPIRRSKPQAAGGPRALRRRAIECPMHDYDPAIMARRDSMQKRYDALVEEMKGRFGLRVRRWRSSMTGCAWIVRYDSGREARLIESPYPRGPMSAAVFLHEVGHHAIGFRTYSPRCLEEFHAWMWALAAMRERGLNVTQAVERRVSLSLHYAIAKARRRGLRSIPEELQPFVSVDRPPPRGHATGQAGPMPRPAPAHRPSTVAAAVAVVRDAVQQMLFGGGRT